MLSTDLKQVVSRVRTMEERGDKKRETLSVLQAGNGSKNSKWWSLSLSLIVESWGGTCD
jgi:hypothetical protein